MDFPKLSNFHISKKELKRNINFSGKNKDFHTDTVSNKDSFAPSEKPAKSNVSAYVCGTLGTFGAGAGIFYGIVAKIKKPFIRKNPAKAIEKLIKTLQPENKDLARNAYPVLLENAEALRIKPENFNDIMETIPEGNREFMFSDGLKLIASKMEKIKDCMSSPEEGLADITRYLNSKNQKIFDTITDDIEKFKITDSEEISLYLDKLNPENYDYMFNTVMPKLSNSANSYKLNMAFRIIELLKRITPETEDMIPKIAATYSNKTKVLNRFAILLNTTPENKYCVLPLIKNAEKMEFTSRDIIDTLQVVDNSKASAINAIADNMNTLKKLELKPAEALKMLPDENAAKVFNTVMSNAEAYKISDVSDIKYYLKNLNPENIDFIEKVAMPKLSKNMEVLGIEYAQDISEVLQKLTPETVESIDTVAKYAQKLGDKVYYSVLLQAIDKNNIKNLPNVLENVSKTDLWDNFLVNTNDFASLLNSAKIG